MVLPNLIWFMQISSSQGYEENPAGLVNLESNQLQTNGSIEMGEAATFDTVGTG